MRSPITPSFVNEYEFSSILKFNNNNKLLNQNIYLYLLMFTLMPFQQEELILEIDDGPYELDFDSLELDQESWEWVHDQVVFEDNEYEID